MTKQKSENLASYFFHQGTSTHAYDYLGCHKENDGFVFRVWAPNADYVSLVGDFNTWSTGAHPLKKVTEAGIWEIFTSEVQEGDKYKYYITNKGKESWKADPYGTFCELPPETASIICDISSYTWHDGKFLDCRAKKYTRETVASSPLNIYEVHLASWKKREDGSYLSYTELADDLSVYVKQMGYTHIELMPVAEHPFDGSWGYQICGYYAPTSRFGTPNEFMAFVDKMHQAGIGVILDWVPAHFPKDAHGLYEFDGQPLYEYQGKDRMEHESWGTRRFDVGREEVQSFLISNAYYWIEKYHIDGLRVDAVASMLYLDYDKKDGEWVPNIYGENKCLEAIAFFRKLNSCLVTDHPDVMTIAEESTAWANVTRFDDGGLGFTMKWNMGWMNDSLAYAAEDPLFRKYHHSKITFSLFYAFSERFLLPISHDEVVHGKRSLLDRMPGEYDAKFAGTRAFLTYMMTHPGKKLLFMGSEFGQFTEWNYKESIEWFLTDYDRHAQLQCYTAELNNLYLATPALWEQDDRWEGFKWIDADNADQSIASYRRIDRNGKEIAVIINFTPVDFPEFLMGVPGGIWEEVLNSDDKRFGGEGRINEGSLKTVPCLLREYSKAIKIHLPPFSAVIFKCTRRAPQRKNKKQ